MAVDLAASNRVVGTLLGPEVTDPLDREVAQAVQAATYRAMLAELAGSAYAPPGDVYDRSRSWGHTFEDRAAQFFAENGISWNG